MVVRLKALKGAATAAVTAFVLLAVNAPAAVAKSCSNDGTGFSSWLEGFKAKAASQGMSQSTINSTLGGISYDRNVIRLDRNQKSFKLSFDQFYARRVSPQLISRGRQKMAQHRATLDRMEKRFGVPAEIVVAIWGLETNYGSDRGQGKSIVQSLATLTYDCRRSAFFEPQLMAALRIVQNGDMSASQLRGGWAGEIGQTQFLPLPYVKYAVDFDGNGHRDLINSVPDILASTANFLKAHGWAAGQDWHPGTKNYAVIGEWNAASVYQRTISVMADKLR
ncbi:MAG: lytic murein transglycosylase [Hyphomicrobium sp.]|nr:lytic murein transglycosylase [Hyphomicrobium sp.]